MTKVLKKLKTAFNYIRYLRIKAAVKLGKLFKDPIYGCQCYRFGKCNLPDGFICEYPDCKILIDFFNNFRTAKSIIKEIMYDGGAGRIWRDWKFYIYFVDNPDKLHLLEGGLFSSERRQEAVDVTKRYVAEYL